MLNVTLYNSKARNVAIHHTVRNSEQEEANVV